MTLYLFLKDVQVRSRNRLRRTLLLVSYDDVVNQERLERSSWGDSSGVQLYLLEYADVV